MEIKFKLLNENATAPYRQHVGDAGYDLFASEVEIVKMCNFVSKNCPNNRDASCKCDSGMAVYFVKTGVSVEIPEGYFGLLCPRSSIYKKGLSMANSPGIIDSSYRGEIGIVFYSHFGAIEQMYKHGDRVAQLLILPYEDVKYVKSDFLSDTTRGEGGFGSTGAS